MPNPEREGGDLSSKVELFRRLWLLVAIALTVALAPTLFPGLRSAEASDVALAAGPPTDSAVAASTTTSPDDPLVALQASAAAQEAMTTTTTLPPATTTTTTVRTPAPAPARVSAPPTTTTTTASVPVAPAPAPVGNTESGKATWYDLKDTPGGCAHKTLPFGTVVTVTNVANGLTTRCTVDDRGPYVNGWILDLHQPEFAQLADPSVGVISVTISW